MYPLSVVRPKSTKQVSLSTRIRRFATHTCIFLAVSSFVTSGIIILYHLLSHASSLYLHLAPNTPLSNIITSVTRDVPDTTIALTAIAIASAVDGVEMNTLPKATIGYAITLTSCPTDVQKQTLLVDGAAVLAHSIHLTSFRSHASLFDYQLYALMYQPTNSSSRNDTHTSSCLSVASSLQTLGYTLVYRDLPIPLSDIIGSPFLRQRISSNGCCGEAELVKLWAYTLVQHPVVVHLDIDTLILKPMDSLFQILLLNSTSLSLFQNNRQEKKKLAQQWKQDMTLLESKISWMWPEYESALSFDPILYPKYPENDWKQKNNSNNKNKKRDSSTWHKRKQLDAFFTRDYNMVPAGKKPVGVQGGFLILRPSMTTFDEYKHILRNGIYTAAGGWGDAGYIFYGSMTFQGLVAYFYDVIHPGTGVELNRCIYNQMVDNPKDLPTQNNVAVGQCRDGREECVDCRNQPMEDIVTVHFTLCQKPWECLSHDSTRIQERLCRLYFGEWYRIRADLEWSWKNDPRLDATTTDVVGTLAEEETKRGSIVVLGNGTYEANHFRGFCKSPGSKGYIPINVPSSRKETIAEMNAIG